MAAGIVPASAGPVPFPLQTTAVTLDGTPLGRALHPNSLNSLRFTVTYNHADGLYHLWVLNGGDATNPSDMQVSDITHATSTDGVNCASKGNQVGSFGMVSGNIYLVQDTAAAAGAPTGGQYRRPGQDLATALGQPRE